jgi:AcrR family transcriptional regulator
LHRQKPVNSPPLALHKNRVYIVYVTPPTRSRILDAARGLFDREGLEGVSMRRIADAVGLTPMAIYRHYADKEALIDALMLDGMAEWESRVAAIVEPDPLVWLARVGQAFLDFALDEPRRHEAAFLLPARGARRYPGDFAAGRSPAIEMVLARIGQAIKAGAMGGASALDIALSFAALAQGLVSMYRAGRFESEAAFRAAYTRAVTHCFQSYRSETR